MVHIRYALHCRLQLHTIASLLISIYFNFERIRLLSTSQTDCSLHNLQWTLYNIKRRKPMKAMQTRRWEESGVLSNFLFVRHRLECLPTHQKRCLTTFTHFHTLENYATDMRYCPRALTPFSSPSVGASPLPPPINFLFVPQKQGKGRVGAWGVTIFYFFSLSQNSIVLMNGFPKSGNQFTIFSI